MTDWTTATYEEARATLRRWREEHVRRSEEVVEIWEHVLSRYRSRLRDELWAVLEQVTIAALDSTRQDLAIDCLQSLNTRFPKSHRVTKLQAMRLESLGKYNDALYLYDKLLESDEASALYRKRKIAVLLAQGERLEAIQELNKYLHTFINDHEAWVQLGKLHIEEGDYAKAVFCFEELLISNPHNAAHLCRLAELRYTLGGAENVEIARNYYLKSSQVATSAAAFYGLMLCCNTLLAKATGTKKKELMACGLDAADQLIELYRQEQDEDRRNDNNGSSWQRSGTPVNPNIGLQLCVIQTMRCQFEE